MRGVSRLWESFERSWAYAGAARRPKLWRHQIHQVYSPKNKARVLVEYTSTPSKRAAPVEFLARKPRRRRFSRSNSCSTSKRRETIRVLVEESSSKSW